MVVFRDHRRAVCSSRRVAALLPAKAGGEEGALHPPWPSRAQLPALSTVPHRGAPAQPRFFATRGGLWGQEAPGSACSTLGQRLSHPDRETASASCPPGWSHAVPRHVLGQEGHGSGPGELPRGSPASTSCTAPSLPGIRGQAGAVPTDPAGSQLDGQELPVPISSPPAAQSTSAWCSQGAASAPGGCAAPT